MERFEEFSEDRKNEQSLYALVNYFKLLTKLQYTKTIVTPLCKGVWKTVIIESDYNKFILIDGAENLKRLANDVETGNINITDYSYKELWQQLLDLINKLNDIKISESYSLKQAKEEVELLINQHMSLEVTINNYVGTDKLNAYELLKRQLPTKLKENDAVTDLGKVKVKNYTTV